MHCAEEGFHNIVVRTIDTDVLVLLISYIPYQDAVCQSNIYAMMGTGGNIDYYDVNNISSTLGYSFCKGLPFFYSFTGCDSLSSFFSIGECIFWDNVFSQQNLEELIKGFQELSNQLENVTSEQIDILEIFVQRIYYPKKLNLEGLNKEWLRHFKRQADTNLRTIPLSKLGLIEHTKRACLQGGWLWRECLHNVLLLDPTLWGWKKSVEGLIPCWQQCGDYIQVNNIIQTCTQVMQM